MPLPHRLLQIGTLALFFSMISGLVLFQSGTFSPKKVAITSDSLPPAIRLDSAVLHGALEQLRAHQQRMYSSKSAPPFPDDLDSNGKLKFTQQDTLQALTLLQMRRDIEQYNLLELLRFEDKSMRITGSRKTYFPDLDDSLLIWQEMKRIPKNMENLSFQDHLRFQTILDSLLRPRVFSSKSGLVFPHWADSTEALTILAAEKRRR